MTNKISSESFTSAIRLLSRCESVDKFNQFVKDNPEFNFKAASDHEKLEDAIEAAIAVLLQLLHEINVDEEMKSKVEEFSSFDNHRIIPVDESDLSPPEPPGTIDPNEIGIPDNARKTKDTDMDLMEQIINDDPDGPPSINLDIYPIRKGDYVSWASPLGRNYGKVEAVVLEGQVDVPDSNLAMIATKDDPVCLTRIWRNDKGEGWLPGDTTIGLKMSALHRISPLEPPKEIAPAIPNTQENSLQKTLNAKGLVHMKAMDNGLVHVLMRATLKRSAKDVTSVDVAGDRGSSSFDITPDDEDEIDAEYIPEGSICCDIQACDTEVDRGSEKFTDEALKSFVKMYPKKPILLDHNWSAKDIVGKVLRGKAEDGKLILRGYIPNTPGNKDNVDNVRAGIFTMVSVGFAAASDNMLCSVCKTKSITETGCPHQPGEELKDGSRVVLIYKDIDDVFEVSIIPVPMQPDSHIKSKSVEDLPGASIINFPPQETHMSSEITKGNAVQVPPGEEEDSDTSYLDDFADDSEEKDYLEKAGDDPKKPYGEVPYADEGLQADGKHRYPIDTEEHIRAAWNYINKPKNQEPYTAEQVAHIKSKIIAAWKKHIDPAGPPSAEKKSETKTADTIINDIDTIKDSLPMSEQAKAGDNLSGLAQVGTEGVEPGVGGISVSALQPTDAVDPAGAGTVDHPTTTEKGMDDGTESSMHDKLDCHTKMIGDIMQAHEKMFGEVRQVHEKCTQMHDKLMEMSGMMKAAPQDSPVADLKKAMDETNLKFAQALVAINEKLDVAMSASTEGVKKMLLEENVSSAPSGAKKKIWVTDFFGVKENNDLGGQQ